MFNFKFPWTKRREARKAAEQKARGAGPGSAPQDSYQPWSSTSSTAPDISGPSTGSASAPVSGHGGSFDGGGASGDWGGSSSSSSGGSDSYSSGSSDSGGGSSSD